MPRTSTAVVAGIRDATGGFGADVVIDAVGLPETWREGFYARDPAGSASSASPRPAAGRFSRPAG
jgi:threonine dehydrogenase-like Zn-dependent dehydrogenase